MARGWMLSCLGVLACACASQAELGRLETEVEMLERQNRQNLALQRAQNEEIGALRARIAQLEKTQAPAGFAQGAPPPRTHVVVVPPLPDTATIDELERLYRKAGRTLDELIGQGHRAASQGLVEEYLSINYHGGMLSEPLRQRYITQLTRILFVAEAIGTAK